MRQVACLVRVPTEVIKSRTQTSTYGPLAGSLHSARMTYAKDGLRGFYRGFGTTVMREVRVLVLFARFVLIPSWVRFPSRQYSSHYTSG